MRQPIRALVGVALTLLVASPAWGAKALKDVRIGKHATFTRIVFELDQPAGYKYERNEPAPGISEIVVSLEASGPDGEIKVPESLIDAVRLQTDGKRTVVNIRLAKAGLRIKEMTLREPPRIVLDVIDDSAAVAPVAVKPKPAPKVVAKATPSSQAKVEAKPEPKPAVEPKVVAKTTPAPKPKAAPAPRPAPAPIPAPIREPKGEPKAKVAPKVETDKEPAAKQQADAAPKAAESPRKLPGSLVNGGVEPEDLAAERPSDPTAPLADSERVVPAAPGASFPGTGGTAAASDSGGLFTPTNLTLALVGGIVLVAGSYLLARRRRDDGDFEDFEDDELGDDNPFAGLESSAPETDDDEASFGDAPIAEAIVVPEATPDSTRQADLFAGSPAAEQSPPASEPAGSIKTEGSDMSMDGTMDFSAAPEAATNLGSDPSAGGDSEGIMRMIRELATRVGDLETRLEDAVDAKERLERQVAAQTEELRVQRAAIARTQRAVRNMSQPIEDTPTEPAPRTPRPE